MAALRSLIGRRRFDAAVAWLATALVVGSAMRFLLAGEPDWAAMSALVVAAALVPPVAARDPAVTMPGELLVAVALPIAVRAAGSFPQATPFLVAAGLALLVAVDLDAVTSLAMTPRFAVVFVVVATLAFAGAWTVGIWVADATLGTAFLGSRSELMWDLVVAAGAGVVAGAVFEAYFARSGRIARLERTGRVRDATGSSTGDGTLPGESRHHRLGVRGMQAALVAIATWALVRGNATLAFNGAAPLLVTFLPAILRREYGYSMDSGLVLWVTIAATLHAVGALGPYEALGWYDSLTHTVSATLVAGVGYAVARSVELHTAEVSFDARFRAAFVVLFVLAVGVVWELFEFGSGALAVAIGGEPPLAQYGASDIAHDLLFDAIGAVVVAAGSSPAFEGMARAFVGRVDALVRG